MNEASKQTVLVVDDEVDLCEILQFDLEDAGYRVLTAYRAAVALDILKKEAIDLIVSDIRMPGGDGVYLLGEVRKLHHEKPPVIFVSGFADVTMAEAYHKGVVAIIAKPLAFETLLQTVQFHLKDARQRWADPDGPETSKCYERSFASLSQAEAEAALLPGRGGLFLKMAEDLPRPGEVVKVSLHLQDEGLCLEGWAACRWIRNAHGPRQPRGAGLEWLKLTTASLDFITSLMRERESLPFIPME